MKYKKFFEVFEHLYFKGSYDATQIFVTRELDKLQAKTKRLAIKRTEERIIKLLETAPIDNPKDYSDEDIWAFQKAIALIKGEQE